MSLYHVHVPRTSGSFIKKIMCNQTPYLNCFLGHTKIIEESDFIDKQFISGHFGTTPLKYCKEAFAVIRDPNELTFSWIKHIGTKGKKDIPFEKILDMYLSPSEFNYAVTNLISKYLTGTTDVAEYNKNYNPNLITAVDNCFFLKNYITDYEDVISFIENNNIKIYIYGSENLYNNLFLKYGINGINIKDYPVVNDSDTKYNYLYNKYFDRINELNDLDMPVYEYFKNKMIDN